MRILHSADWHLDSPIVSRTPEARELLRRELLKLPQRIAYTAIREGCDMMVLSGDLFDGPYTQESLKAVYTALEEVGIPVCIAPGNHDFYGPNSPWQAVCWSQNVHIFTTEEITSVAIPELNCRVFGAAFTTPYCDSLLANFRAKYDEVWAIGVFHGDPTQASSIYCPVTEAHVRGSGLDYLALGHIHSAGSFTAGNTLCAWPGVPMGRGYDETGEKGVLIVDLDDKAVSRFLPLNTLRFHDLEVPAGNAPAAAVSRVLPAAANNDFYRVTLTGECPDLDIATLAKVFNRFPNLELRDRTVPPIDLWASAGKDTLEGVYFSLLRQTMKDQTEEDQQRILLAAKISRQILDGQEVVLP